jgi:NADH-quinone oxidoreductase subunit J
MLFAFMLSNRELLSGLQIVKAGFKIGHLVGFLICGGLFFLLSTAIFSADIVNLPWIQESQVIGKNENTIHQIGIHTMTRYLLPFEMVSVFLMMALIGAAHLARKEKRT